MQSNTDISFPNTFLQSQVDLADYTNPQIAEVLTALPTFLLWAICDYA